MIGIGAADEVVAFWKVVCLGVEAVGDFGGEDV